MKLIFEKLILKTFKYIVGMGVFLSFLSSPKFVFAAPQTVQDHLQNDSGTAQAGDATVQSIASTSWTSILNTILALAILVAIIYFGLKFMNRKLEKVRSASGVQILVQQSLATNRSIHVVDIAGQLYVLGVGDTITCLDKITDEKLKTAFLGKIEQTQKDTALNRNILPYFKIKEKINSIIKRIRQQKETTDLKETDSMNFQETLERQLESLRSIRESIEHEPQSRSERHDET